MADPRTVRLVLAAALAARAAWGASPCEEGRAQTGLALAAREGGLEIAAVDAGSAAAESGLHAGDTLVQVNAATNPDRVTTFSKTFRVGNDVRV